MPYRLATPHLNWLSSFVLILPFPAGLCQAPAWHPLGLSRCASQLETASCSFLSNLRITGSKPDALPLAYAPSELVVFVRSHPAFSGRIMPGSCLAPFGPVSLREPVRNC